MRRSDRAKLIVFSIGFSFCCVSLVIVSFIFNEAEEVHQPWLRHSIRIPKRISTPDIETFNTECNTHDISIKKFVLSLSYWEQLTMATIGLCQLAQFSKFWGARAVAPFTYKAELWGLPSNLRFNGDGLSPTYDHIGQLKTLDSLYNMTLFNSELLCKKNNIPPLANFKEFITNANRTINMLHFSFDGHTPYLKTVNLYNYTDCLQTIAFRKISKIVLKFLNKEAGKKGLAPFTVGQACCVNHRHIVTPQEMADKCGFSNQKSLSVIVTVWRGYSNVIKKDFRLVVPKKFPSFKFNSFPLSNDLLANVTAYYKDISHEKEFIAVHLRTVKLGLLDYNSGKQLSTKCFDTTWKLVSKLQEKHKELPVKYFIDYGKHGSHSFEIDYGKRISKKPLKEKNIIPLYYDPVKYGGIEDQGFVALVEQSTIAKAKVLILVGGGSFQHQIMSRFSHDKKLKKTHNLFNVYTVCWPKEYTKKFINKMVYRTNLQVQT